MSEQIDWSKAPEGATHRGAINWFKSDGEKVYTFDGAVWHPVSWEIWQLAPFAKRPSIHADEWSGEGLPPVGVVCEYCCVNNKWRQVKVIAHMIEMQKDKPCAVSQLGDTGPLCIGGASSFRPIRTPEQIAADERDAAIKELQREMMPAYDAFAEPLLDVITRLGYRKP